MFKRRGFVSNSSSTSFIISPYKWDRLTFGNFYFNIINIPGWEFGNYKQKVLIPIPDEIKKMKNNKNGFRINHGKKYFVIEEENKAIFIPKGTAKNCLIRKWGKDSDEFFIDVDYNSLLAEPLSEEEFKKKSKEYVEKEYNIIMSEIEI